MINRAVAQTASRQLGVITRAQALGCGVSATGVDRRVADGRWRRLERGVYLMGGAPLTWPVQVLAACLATGGVASHRCGAALLEQRGFARSLPEVTVPRGTRFGSVQARVHQSRDFELIEPIWREGVPVTPPERLVVDLGAVVSFERFDRVVVDMVGMNLLTWEAALDALLRHSRPGRPGLGPLRAVLSSRYGEEIDKSVLERACIRLMEGAGIPLPEHQVPIYDADGFIARVDLVYPTLRLILELDGRLFHGEDVFEADRDKRNRLVLAGWTVLELTWKMIVARPHVALARITSALALAATGRPEARMH